MNEGLHTAGYTGTDATSLDSLSGVLKDVYLPGINNTIFFDNKFTALIQNAVGQMDATGRQIVAAFQTQRSAGVGPISEGGTFVDSVPIDGFQGTEWIKYGNMYVEFTGPAISTVQAGQGSFVDLVDSHLTSMIQAEKLNVERILTGAGDGVLGYVNDATPTGATLTVKGGAFFDTQHMEKGTHIEFHDPASFGTPRTLTGPTGDSVQITELTYGNKRTAASGTITVDTAITAGLTDGDAITRKGAYGQINRDAGLCLEQNGLMNLVSDGATDTYNEKRESTAESTLENYQYIWGKPRSSHRELQSIIHDINGELDEEALLTVCIEAEYQYQTDPNLLMVTPRALNKYFLNSKDDRRFNTMTAFEWTGGYKGLGIQLNDKQMMLTALASCPSGYGFLINVNDFAFVRPAGMQGYKWLTGQGGSVLNQKEDSDNQFATAVAYWQFCCMKPDKQIKLHGIVE
jgi:hypothetical protein